MIRNCVRATVLPIVVAILVAATFSLSPAVAQGQDDGNRVDPGFVMQTQERDSETVAWSFASRLFTPICTACESADGCAAGTVGCCLAQITICPEPEPRTRGGADGPDPPTGIFIIGGGDGPDPPTGG